jgi:hypothetical protein
MISNPESQKQRLMARNQYSEQEAMNRITAQIPIEEKRSKSSLEIDNSGSLENTKLQVKAISSSLLQHRNSLIWYMVGFWPCLFGYLLIRAMQFSYYIYITRYKRRDLFLKLK